MTRRLIVALVLLCLAEGLLVGVLVHRATQRSFEAFVREGAVQSFRRSATSYYQAHGTWEGFDAFLRQEPGARGPGMPPPMEGAEQAPPDGPPPFEGDGPPPGMEGPGRNPAGRPPRYGLADASGRVVLSDGVHAVGTTLDAASRARAIPLAIDGAERARILIPATAIPADSPERRFLDQADRALQLAIVFAVLLATLVGILLARAYTRPLRALTVAARTLERGRFGAQVEGRAPDDLGALTEAFNRMSDALARADGQRRQMTADLAHELNTPLTVIAGYLEVMERGELPVTQDRLRAVHGEAGKMKRIVAQLRTLAVAEAGGMPLRRQPTEPRALLEDLAAAFEAEAMRGGVRLTLDAAPALTTFLLDRDTIGQVLSNLISNALRYTPAGGSVTLGASRDGDGLVLTVRDTGRGIDPAALPHVFDRFTRADPSRHESEHSGLGLAIAKALVEAHGGTIGVESEPGRGTTFTIRLLG